MLPTCYLPLWGREGVTLLAAAENKRITGKRGFQQSQKNLLSKKKSNLGSCMCALSEINTKKQSISL
jgi:hypothetical protein